MNYDEKRSSIIRDAIHRKAIYSKRVVDLDEREISDVILYWGKTYGTYYYNCMTGVGSYELKEVKRYNVDNIYLKKGCNSGAVLGYYLFPTKLKTGEDVLTVNFCRFNTSTVPKGTRGWEVLYNDLYGGYVIDKEMNVYSPSPYTTGTAINQRIDITRGETIDHSWDFCCPYTSKLLSEFSGKNGTTYQLRPIVFANNNAVQALCAAKKTKTPLKKQEIVDELVKKPLAPVEEKVDKSLLLKFICEGNEGDLVLYRVANAYTAKNSFAIAEKIENGIAVIRVFMAYIDANDFVDEKWENKGFMRHPKEEELKFFEYARTYVTDEESIDCQFCSNKWSYVKKGQAGYKFSYIMLPWNRRSLKGTKLEYLKSINEGLKKAVKKQKEVKDSVNFDTSEICKISRMMHYIFEIPLIEAFISSEYDALKKAAFRDSCKNASDTLSSLFGKIDKKQANLQKAIGVPKFMLKEANDRAQKAYDERKNYSYYISVMQSARIIKDLKFIYESCPEYLERMNKDLFLKIISEVFPEDETKENIVEILAQLVKLYGPKNTLEYISFLRTGLCNLKGTPHNPWYYNKPSYLHKDYIDMAEKISGYIHINKWRFSTYDSLKKAHDELVTIYNAYKDRAQYEKVKEKFENQKKKWEPLEYEEEEFCIIKPEEAVDIANEGLELHHCVKTYIDSVAAGRTIILFIRKTAEKNTPFYTLEVQNKKVRQCHGFCNSTIDKQEGLEEFLTRYCEEKNIEFARGERALCAN